MIPGGFFVELLVRLVGVDVASFSNSNEVTVLIKLLVGDRTMILVLLVLVKV